MRSDAITNMTRLYLLGSGDEDYRYLGSVAVWRIMWRGGKPRAILRQYWPAEFLRNFPDGAELVLKGGPVVDPSLLLPGELIQWMNNCHVTRKWIPWAGARGLNDVDVLSCWLEIEFDED